MNEQFVRLFAANERRIYTFILALLPNRENAEDVFQNTSVVLWRKFEEFQPGTDFLAWTFRVARLEVRNFIAKDHRRPLVFDDRLLETLATEAEQRSGELSLRQEALRHCLERLAPRDRDLLQRRYEQGATIKSTAEAVGRPVEGLYKAMRRIHDALFECVQRRIGQGVDR